MQADGIQILPDKILTLVSQPSLDSWLRLGDEIARTSLQKVRHWSGPLDDALEAWPTGLRVASSEPLDWGPPAWIADLEAAPDIPLRWARVIRTSAHTRSRRREFSPAILPHATTVELVCDADQNRSPDPTDALRLLQITPNASTLRCFSRGGRTHDPSDWDHFWKQIADVVPIGNRPEVQMHAIPAPSAAFTTWLTTRHPSCHTLRLSGCDVDDGMALRALEGSALRRLALPFNRITRAGVTSVVRTSEFASLQALDLSGNEGQTTLLAAIEALPKPLRLSSLTAVGGQFELDLNHLNAICCAGFLPHLNELTLRNATIDEWTAFGWNNLNWIAKLTRLDLRGCPDAAPFVARVLEARSTSEAMTILLDPIVAAVFEENGDQYAGVTLSIDELTTE